MKNKIELNEPFMNSNPYLSILFSFVEVNEMTIAWLLKFFTGVYAFTKTEDDEFDMEITGFTAANLLNNNFIMCCPFVDICRIDSKLIKNDIKDVLSNSINNGYCAAIVINPQFINAYGNIALNEHELLINGYDFEKNTLLVKDFFAPSYKFVQCEISCDEFFAAFKARNTKYCLRFIRKRQVSVMPTAADLINTLVEVLNNMVNGNCQVENPYYPVAYKVYGDKAGVSMPANSIWYGIDAYNGMFDYLDKIPNKFWIMLSDSKRLIYFALNQLNFRSKEVAVLLYENILSNLRRLLNMNIKFVLTKDNFLLKRMGIVLMEIRDTELKAIEVILSDLH